MLRVELLPAGYGDAILVSYGPGDTHAHTILIDAGQASTTSPLMARLDELRRSGKRVDLFVVTHVDADHIGGAVKLLKRKATAGMIDTIWFNGYVHLDNAFGLLGAVQGEKFTKQIVAQRLAWNTGWPHPVDVAAGFGGPIVVTQPTQVPLPGGATATVLSPTPAKLAKLLVEWTQIVTDAGLRPRYDVNEEPELVAPGLLGATLDDLAGLTTNIDTAEANGSSIAFVFEYDDTRILFGADAHPDVLTSMLAATGEQPYPLAACKLPHHGSKHNVTSALVAALDCPLWLVSTNGVRFSHPDDIALARVIAGATGGPPEIGWNYAADRFTSFTADYPPETSGYSVQKPTPTGLVIDF